MRQQFENSIQKIRMNLFEMWSLVQGQVERASVALLQNNKEVAREVRNLEKMVDTYELMIDRECEHFLALLNPVAVDMRLIVSILKINNDLERIGDFADSIAKTVIENHMDAIPDALIKKLKLDTMFELVSNMFSSCKIAFDEENSKLTAYVFAKDDAVDEINEAALSILAEYMKTHTDDIYDCLYLSRTIRRIERIGDRCNNIAEEIVFYLEARVLKHTGKDNSHK